MIIAQSTWLILQFREIFRNLSSCFAQTRLCFTAIREIRPSLHIRVLIEDIHAFTKDHLTIYTPVTEACRCNSWISFAFKLSFASKYADKHLCDITSTCAFTSGNKTLKLNTLSFSLSLTSFAISLVVFTAEFRGKELSLNAFTFSGYKASAVFMIHSIMNSPSRDGCECRAINPDTVKLISTAPSFSLWTLVTCCYLL